MRAPLPEWRLLSAALGTLAAGFIPSPARAFTTVPECAVVMTIPAAINTTTPSSTTLSIPLYQAADVAAGVASIDSATQFTLAGAAWSPNQFGSPSAPRLVRIKASNVAANVGRFFLIKANTANQVTVALPKGVSDLHQVLSVDDICEILPANTLGSVFGNAVKPPTLAGGHTPSVADNVLLWDGVSWTTYFWTGTSGTPNNIWKTTGNIDRSQTVIFPDEAVFVMRRQASAAMVVMLGTVPSTTERTEIDANSSHFIANRFPTDITLATLGGSDPLPALNLQNVPGWVAGSTPSTADKVFIWDTAANTWGIYFWTGMVGSPKNIWKRAGNIDRSDTVIRAGSGVFISHSGPETTLTQTLPYQP